MPRDSTSCKPKHSRPGVEADGECFISCLSFLLLEGAWDKAEEWANELTASQRASIKTQYANAGIKLLVSAFGSTDVPTTTNADPIATANTMAAWVKQYSLDGIDVDYEVCELCSASLLGHWTNKSFRTLARLTRATAKLRPG